MWKYLYRTWASGEKAASFMAEAITDDGCELDLLMSAHKARQLGLTRTLQAASCNTVAEAITI